MDATVAPTSASRLSARVPCRGAALTHGFGIAFYALAAATALGALLAALMIESRPAKAEPAPQVDASCAGAGVRGTPSSGSRDS